MYSARVYGARYVYCFISFALCFFFVSFVGSKNNILGFSVAKCHREVCRAAAGLMCSIQRHFASFFCKYGSLSHFSYPKFVLHARIEVLDTFRIFNKKIQL